MKNKTSQINEDVQLPDHDVNGMGSSVPGPVDTGVAARPQDNLGETDAPIGVVQGQPVPRSAVLRALVSTLQGLDAVSLDRIANELDANQDVNVDPANSVPDLQGANLASIAVKEDIAEIFSGEETLSEEFKERTALVFEAAVNTRVAIVEAELREQQEVQISEAVETVTEQLVNDIDRYISFAAESFVEENTPILEQTVRSVTAERFMSGVIALAEQFNIDIPESTINVAEELNSKIEGLNAQLNEALESNINAVAELKEYKKREIFEEVSGGLTEPQKERLRTLSENVSIDTDIDIYRSSLQTLSSSIASTTSRKPVVEETEDNGVLIQESAETVVPLNKTEGRVFDILTRMG